MIKAATARALRSLTLAACCTLGACTTGSVSDIPSDEPAVTTGSGKPANSQSNTGREKAIASYRNYLQRYPDSPEYDRITRRLADLLLEQAADMELAPGSGAQQAYTEAIGLYEYLLAKYPDGSLDTAVLYQLSRAYEQSGQPRQALRVTERLLAQEAHPDTRLFGDVSFRQGEMLFAQGDYVGAGDSYQAVIDLGEAAPAYEQSLYKLGWSLFKQERYSEALPVLFSFLDRKASSAVRSGAHQGAPTAADKEQVADVYRVISMSFAQLGGVESVQEYFTQNSANPYRRQIYMALAAWYVEQEQVNGAAGTWLALARDNPLDDEAPRLTARAINLYREAGFQQRVIALEKTFVETYGMETAFWETHSPDDYPQVVQLLQSSLQELAQLSHAGAQESGSADQVREAQYWYRQYLASFGDEAGAAQMKFQLAELLYYHGQYSQALDEYEQAAWSYGDHPSAVDAALGAQHANQQLRQEAGAADHRVLMDRAVAGTAHFMQHNADHPAAAALLTSTGKALLENQQNAEVLKVSEQALAAAAAPTEVQQTAWSLRAQALFALENYAEAATAYNQALQLAADDDARRPALQAGLATATYQQAEQAMAQDNKAVAAALYQQAAGVAPDRAIRSRAEYDAATILLELQSWPDAIRLLAKFRREYPDDPLAKHIPQKLAYAYESNGLDNRAALEYRSLGQDLQQPEPVQREALLRAVELFRKIGAAPEAISTSEYYLERFTNPPEVAVVLMQQLADDALNNADTARRRDWLQEIISLDRAHANAATRTPAAEAALAIAQMQLEAFRRIRLNNPVQKHLTQKIDAMKRTLLSFEAAMDYGNYAVTTEATYHIASMYDELGSALLQSERPGGLTEQERQEYEALLAQQAAGFEQQAISIHQSNVQRSGGSPLDTWIAKSEQKLNELQRPR